MDTADDDLMQLVLDGAATPTERARLERRMEQDRALRARFEAMERGFRALDARPVEAAPAGLREDILAAIAAEPEPARARPSWFTRWFTSAITLDSTSHPASARRAGHHPQEVQMNNRNAIIGAIAAVALVLVVLNSKGMLPGSSNTQGTIGAANRATENQISGQDVKVEDSQAAVQAFLQSDAFHKMQTDPGFKKAVASGLDKAVTVGGLDKYVSESGLGKMVTNADVAKAITSGDLGKVVSDPGFGKLIASADFGKLVQAGGLGKSAELGKQALAAGLNKANLEAFNKLMSSEFGKMISDPSVQKVATDPGFGKMVSDPVLMKLVTDPSFGKLVTNADFGKMVSTGDFGKAADLAKAAAAAKSATTGN